MGSGLLGMIVAAFGIAAALSVGSAAGANSSAEVLTPQIKLGKSLSTARVNEAYVVKAVSEPASSIAVRASPESVCRTRVDEKGGKAKIVVAFVGVRTCTVSAFGPGSNPETATAQASYTVLKNAQYKPRMSARVRAELLQDAEIGDKGPRSDVRAVLATEAEAHAKTGLLLPEKLGEAYVYVVAMRGDFHSKCHKIKAGGPCVARGYRVEELAVLPLDNEVEGAQKLNSYPDLASLGAPVRLSRPKAR